MKTLTLILTLVIGNVMAETLILPTHPGTNTIDITQPGIKIEGDTIYQTIPGPMGIINPIGTTYKREGDEYVPHKGILGPQNFDLPSYRVETDGGYGRPVRVAPLPVPRPLPSIPEWRPQGLLPPLPVVPIRQIQPYGSDDVSRLNAELQETQSELRELREQAEYGEDDYPGSDE